MRRETIEWILALIPGLVAVIAFFLTKMIIDIAAEGDNVLATIGTLGITWMLFESNYLHIRRLEAKG